MNRSIKALFIGVALMIVVAGCTAADTQSPAAVATEAETGVRIIDPAIPISEFTLTDQNGSPIAWSALHNKPLIVSFGFTHCPDVCPINLAEYKAIKKELGINGQRVTFVFISVDGKRDTPEALKKYIDIFDSEFVGLTGDDGAVRPVTQQFGVRYEIATPVPGQSGYTVTHTASKYFIDTEGNIRRIYSFNTPSDVIAEDVKVLLG